MTVPAGDASGARPSDTSVTVGRITGLFGVRGWVKVYSYTRPPEAILEYSPWLVQRHGAWQELILATGRRHGHGIVARLDGYDDRERAAGLVGADIYVRLAQLPRLAPGQYYWTQLEGLRVCNVAGEQLGTVSHLFETGANDVMVVKGERERLIPYTAQVVRRVDLEAKLIEVDWDAGD